VIHKINIAMALIVLFTASVLAQSNSSRIGDDYARAALRVIIYTNQSGITAQRISILLDEADVEASTPAEEASLRPLPSAIVWGPGILTTSLDTSPSRVCTLIMRLLTVMSWPDTLSRSQLTVSEFVVFLI